ncbi:MAG: multidrug effflux MFS transporter [Alphaproteobacteria bacterium]
MTDLPRGPHFATLTLMAALSVVSLNMIVPAFGEMAQEFGVSYATINILFSGYLVITGVMTLLLGPISDRFGRRPVALIGVGLFVFASLVCAAAPNVTVLFIGRIVQCVVVAGSVMAQTIVRDTAINAQDATRRMASIAMVMGLAPLLAPTFGGFLADMFDWRTVFLVQGLIGLLTLILLIFDLKETNQAKSSTFGAQFRAHPALLAAPRFWGNTLMLCFGISTFFAFLAGMPLIGIAHFELSQTQIGITLGTLTVGYVIANAITRQVARRVRGSTLMVTGRLVGVVGAGVSLVLILNGVTSAALILPPMMLIGAANGFSLQAANVGVVSVNRNLAGSAAGLSGAMINWVGAGATAIMGYALQANPAPSLFIALLLGASTLALLPALLIALLDRHQDRAGGSKASGSDADTHAKPVSTD